MSVETVQALHNAGFFLYGFKAVEGPATGRPLVWFKNDTYSAVTNIVWEEVYQAYTSSSQIIPGGRVTGSFFIDIDPGQTLEVGVGGVGFVTPDGDPDAITIENTTTTEYTCGISQLEEGEQKTLCAFPLFGMNADLIVPISKVLLMFSTDPVDTGTVIMQAYSPGLLIDLTGVEEREVGYNINGTWTYNSLWAQPVSNGTDLVPLLITDGAGLAE